MTHRGEQMVTLHIYLTVKEGQGAALEALYHAAYIPAISRQEGFRGAHLLRAYDSAAQYEIDITFDSEEQRARWASSADHEATWPRVVALCEGFSAQGYDILA
jgi:heme-degrading monooxygenase HmoA